MTHDEFLMRYRAGKLLAGVDHSTALKLIRHLPKRYQYAHNLWSLIWVLSIPFFIAVAVVWKWWAGLLMLLIITPMIFSATKKSAAQSVLEHAIDHKDFFEFLDSGNLLMYREIP
jgi:hypothetical protein